MKCCENCGWLSVNPSGAMFCGYSDQRTWKDECCMAWKDKDEPLTNADRIRAMTDEELANFLYEEADYPKEEYWLKWLKEEAKTDG